jgi:mono/diheme cytochrome c family protein
VVLGQGHLQRPAAADVGRLAAGAEQSAEREEGRNEQGQGGSGWLGTDRDPIMICARMRRWLRVLVLSGAAVAVAAATAACGTERITVPKSNAAVYQGAVLFSQRCSGCHTLNYAGTHGSAPNIRTAQAINGPNFNVTCERPITRVLYAIENGGFSGAYMPQNIVVGQDAAKVAEFVSTYAGRLAPKLTGVVRCQQLSIGTLPTATTSALAAASATSTSSSTSATTAASSHKKKRAKTKRKRAHA